MDDRYKFTEGDVVITTSGEKGKIINICKCSQCERRGFYEPIWVVEGINERRYISIDDARSHFKGFYQIGEYRFDDFDRSTLLTDIASCEAELDRLKKQLELMEELEA